MRYRFHVRAIAVLLLCVVMLGFFLSSVGNVSMSRSLRSLWGTRRCSCDQCLPDNSPCFKGMLTNVPELFLSKEHGINEVDFKWWKGVQGEKRNLTFYNETVKRVFEMFPSFPTLLGPHPDRCRSCAVVGNSGTLRGSHFGPLIDRHNIVVRVNRGRTEGFEEDVGAKTTHRVMYPESKIQLDNSTHLLFFPFKTNDFIWLMDHFRPDSNGAMKPGRIANKDLVSILNPAFMRYVHRVWLRKVGHYPSTGFMALALSTFFCDEVNVFGFGADINGNWDHYYEILRNKNLKTGGHPGSTEYTTIEEFHNMKIIQFFKAL